jgi:hypothetical protein
VSIEEGRLAGVGVADERHRRHSTLLTQLAQLRAPPPNGVDFVREHADAMANPAAIGFELGFARAPGADAAAESRERRARTDEPREQVFELRELDLELAFARASALGEDVQDELRAVDDLPAQRSSRLRSWAGLSSLSKTTSAPSSSHDAASAFTFPLPRNVAGSGFGRS